MFPYWPHLTLLTALDVVVILVFIPWVLLTKKDATKAVAWCLVVLLMPLVGALLFWMFGYNYLLHRVRHRRRSRPLFRERHAPVDGAPADQATTGDLDPADLSRLAREVNAFPATDGNAVTLYHETRVAFADLLHAVEQARHHVHLEFFILRGDATGTRLLDLLARKAKEGVQVRLLYDGMGSLHLKRRALEPLLAAGGRAEAFLPLNPVRSLIRVNLRNHRKIVVIDGKVGFTGGMNIGDEYLGKSEYFGYWRDSFLRVRGPAVAGLQRVFCEDWDFATQETVRGDDYFPPLPPEGDARVQVADSGPTEDLNTLREIFFMAILSARRRLWISSPYLIPDSGIVDALRVARYRGVDVRLLTLLRPDHYVSYYASRYYESELLAREARIYQYAKGMMHSKVMMVDGEWGLVGSANLDNRSLHLNFEVGCLLYSPPLVAELEAAFLRDLEDSVPLDARAIAGRSWGVRVVENACRLMSPGL